MAKKILDPRLVKEFFRYDGETGRLIWNVEFNDFMRIGKVAGYKGAGGFVIGVFGGVYSAARLVWAYHHGEWPSGILRHKNKDRYDDRIENLIQGKKRIVKPRPPKAEYKTYKDIPIEYARECFSLDKNYQPVWKKKVGPRVKVGELAGRMWGKETYVGFCGFKLPVHFIVQAIALGVWPEKEKLTT